MVLSYITQTGLKLVVLDFGFVCSELVQHRLCSYRLGTQYILVSTSGPNYILAGTYGTHYILLDTYETYYILAGTNGTHYIIHCSCVRHRLYSSHLSIDF